MLLVWGPHFKNHCSTLKAELSGHLLHERSRKEPFSLPPSSGCIQHAHKLSSQENHVLGRWHLTLLLTSRSLHSRPWRFDCEFSSSPWHRRKNNGQRTRRGRAQLSSTGCELRGLGQDSDRCNTLVSLSACIPISPSCSKGVMGQP